MSTTSDAQPSRRPYKTRLFDAIECFGIEETLELIEFYLGNNLRTDKIERAEHHPAFQILERKKQTAIHRDKDKSTLRNYMHSLLRLLCRVHEVSTPPERDRDAWQPAIDAVYAAMRRSQQKGRIKDTARVEESVDDGRPKKRKATKKSSLVVA